MCGWNVYDRVVCYQNRNQPEVFYLFALHDCGSCDRLATNGFRSCIKIMTQPISYRCSCGLFMSILLLYILSTQKEITRFWNENQSKILSKAQQSRNYLNTSKYLIQIWFFKFFSGSLFFLAFLKFFMLRAWHFIRIFGSFNTNIHKNSCWNPEF